MIHRLFRLVTYAVMTYLVAWLIAAIVLICLFVWIASSVH